ncbi:MAG: hypothetical protein IBX55_21525 [Methyloprofundus sp.]|nr:hypothetical protein [Methyloprofundus sp.]
MNVKKSDLSKLLLFFLTVVLFSVFTLYAELNGVNSFLPTFSFILFLLIFYANLYLNKNDFLSPLTFFSIMYFGYVIGGYYYSFSKNEFGKFIEFTNITDDEVLVLMKYGLLLASLSFIFFVIGYSIFSRRVNFLMKNKAGFFSFYGRYYLVGPE